jgi:hypothetical protein
MAETRAERRERIAAQMMAALCSPQHKFSSFFDQAHDAVAMANALMVILDNEAANDKQKGGE